MAKEIISVSAEEMYPVYFYTKKIEPNEVGLSEISSSDLEFIQKAFDQFNKAQDILFNLYKKAVADVQGKILPSKGE